MEYLALAPGVGFLIFLTVVAVAEWPTKAQYPEVDPPHGPSNCWQCRADQYTARTGRPYPTGFGW